MNQETRSITLNKEEMSILLNALTHALEEEYDTVFDEKKQQWYKRKKPDLNAITALKNRYENLQPSDYGKYVLNITADESSLLWDQIGDEFGRAETLENGEPTSYGKKVDDLVGRFGHLFDD